MISRQKSILRLIENENGELSTPRLVTLAFLLRQRSQTAPKAGLYDFIPYLDGPYSFTLSYELKTLERDGWLRVMDATVKITNNSAAPPLDKGFLSEIDQLSKELRRVPTERLVADVYRDFPWYTANAKNEANRAATIPTARCSVFTVGYEGLMLDALLDLLLQSGIKRLVDVRRNPVARRFGFHRSTLERHCQDVGLIYQHFPELGIPSSWRTELDCMAAYERLFEKYEGEVLPAQTHAIEAVSALVKEVPSALMCMEADCRCCHRTRLARIVAVETGLPVQELRE